VGGSNCLLTFGLWAGTPFKNFFNQSYGGHDCDKPSSSQQPLGAAADGKKVLTLNSSIRYCALRPAPQLQYTGKLWLVRELPKNRRRTEVPVSFVAALVPSAGTITL
jgi:hypothetical protein